MKKWLLIGAVAVMVTLFFGVQMLTEETNMGENISISSENAPQVAQKTDDNGSFFSLVASEKELTPAQKKLQKLGFYPDKFQSIRIKTK